MLQIPEAEATELRRRVTSAIKEQFPDLTDETISGIYDTVNSTVAEYYNQLKA